MVDFNTNRQIETKKVGSKIIFLHKSHPDTDRRNFNRQRFSRSRISGIGKFMRTLGLGPSQKQWKKDFKNNPLEVRKKRLHSIKNVDYKKIFARKNFFLTSVAMVVIWASLFVIVAFFEPTLTSVIFFFLLLFFGLLLTFSVIFANSRRGLFTSLTISLILLFRLFGIGNIINLALLAGIILAVEIYFSSR